MCHRIVPIFSKYKGYSRSINRNHKVGENNNCWIFGKKSQISFAGMSSQDPDVDINVVSSPEQSPQPEYSTANTNFPAISTTMTNTTANHVLINSISESSRLSLARTPPDNGKISANSGYTSFTISSILSRSDNKKESVASANNLPFIDATGASVHEAAMISRYVK